MPMYYIPNLMRVVNKERATTQRFGPDGCSGDRTLGCPMQLKLEPRSPLVISSHRSTVFPPHGSQPLSYRCVEPRICSASQQSYYRLPDVTCLRSPTSSHSVLQIKKRKRITRCGNPLPAFTPHVCPHTSNFAHVCQRGLRLYPRDSPGHAAEYPGEKVRPPQYYPHQQSRFETDRLLTCPLRALSSPQRLLLLEVRAHDGAGGARAQRSLPETPQISFLALHVLKTLIEKNNYSLEQAWLVGTQNGYYRAG